MNEIYKAIEHFEHLQKRYTTQHNGKHCELVKTALAALREQAERNKGCGFCCYTEYPDKELYPKEGYTFYAGFYKQINVDAFAEGELEKLKFCPSCGRRLEVGHE